MKLYEYTVYFVTGKQENVWAIGEEEAIILAQAKQIQAGNAYIVSGAVL